MNFRYGLGSASDLYNPEAVVQIVEQLLAPLLIGDETLSEWDTAKLIAEHYPDVADLRAPLSGDTPLFSNALAKKAGLAAGAQVAVSQAKGQ